jgi:hypothetical protein
MGLLSFNVLYVEILIFYFLNAHTQKWQNCQRADGGHILVEVEVENPFKILSSAKIYSSVVDFLII